ncbi:MAG: hypothetical protein ACYCO9_15330 [Streptosporangiaceae bacterium]
MRLIGYLFGPVFGLLAILLFVYGGVMLADPAAVGAARGAGLVLRSLIGLCGGAGAALFALRIARTALLERLRATSDGLVSQEAGWGFRTRTRTIPWPSITSFSVQQAGRMYTVFAVLASGEWVELAATGRKRRSAERIAGDLTGILRAHDGGSVEFRRS